MEKSIVLVLMKLETDGYGIYSRSGVKTIVDDILGDEKGAVFSDYFKELFIEHRLEAFFDKLAFKFGELSGRPIDVVVDTEELEKQMMEAQGNEI